MAKLTANKWSYHGEQIGGDTFSYRQYSTDPVSGIVFHCRGNPSRICEVAIREGEAIKPIHGWDGNREEPTITPSIGCDHRCGWHGHITKGDFTP